MKNAIQRTHYFLFTILLGLSLASCGGESSDSGVALSPPPGGQPKAASETKAAQQPGGQQPATSQSSQPAEEASDTTVPPGEIDKEIVIKANDKMQFDITEFTVPAGGTIKLTIDNVGTMPKISMGHNVVILKQSAKPLTFANAAMTKAANDYIPPAMTDQIIAHTKMTGGGETDTITFQAPETPGRYDYLCSFPGHFQAGMKGVMIVE